MRRGSTGSGIESESDGRVNRGSGGRIKAAARLCLLSGAALGVLLSVAQAAPATLLSVARAAPAAARDPAYSQAAQSQAAQHLSLLGHAGFDANDLITDVNFTDSYCLSQADVQGFLATQPGILAALRTTDHLGVKRSAAAIICQAAKAWQVSPKVILATLQKEQGLLSATSPSAGALDWAMGCGVPDSGGRNTTYQGFGNQLWYGAESLHADGRGWSSGTTKTCGDGSVKPVDEATYALYCYTPWIGLAGGGNKLFWTLYWQYFGDPLAVDRTAPVTTVTGADQLWHAQSPTITFSATDGPGGSGVVATQYSLDGSPWTQATSLTVAAPADHADDGAHTIRYRAIDYAGNVEQVQSCRVKIDTSAPRPMAGSPATAVRGQTARLRYYIADRRPGSPTASVTIRVRTLGGRLVRKLIEPDSRVDHRLVATFTCRLARGNYRFFVSATDAAGNRQVKVARNRLRVR